MSDANQAANPVYDSIVSAVNSAWNDDSENSHKAVLLSSLGKKLKDEFGDYSAHFPKGIKEFLRTWPLVQLVQHPEIKEKIGLIPAGEPLPKDIASLFQKAGERRAPTYPISYDQDFWNAFFKPIRSTRHVVFDEYGRLKVLDDAQCAPSGAYEIEKSDLLPSDQATPVTQKVALTHEQINKWLVKNSLDASQFARKHVTRSAEHQDRLASLKHAFEKISDADKARILIPLDVILKILS